MLSPETIVQHRYTIVRLLGRGGMGAVYLATDQRFGSMVALKQTLVRGETLAKAFEREARLLNGLRHPALPVVTDYFGEGGSQFLVMQYIPGDDLGQSLIQNGGPFDPRRVLAWADQLLGALEYLHSRTPPIVHRDIKPQNLKLTPEGEVVLLDFGLAKGALGHMTEPAASSVAGFTPCYAPLEQMRGEGTDARSDLYGLAATLYTLLTAKVPSDALTRADTVLQGRRDPLVPPEAINSRVSRAVSEALLSALALKRAERPQSATHFRTVLRRANARSQPARRDDSVSAGTTLPLSDMQSDDTTLMPAIPVEASGEACRTDGLSQPPNNLPNYATGFIGRGEEVVRIRGLFESSRVVTLVGPGGIGKTRLAVEVASGLCTEYRDGVWFAELATLVDPTLVPKAIAMTLGLAEEAGQSLQGMLARSLKDKRTLLVLDNCEHLIEACASLAEALVKSCPNLALLTTSRENLGVTGEAIWEVDPLSVPEKDERVSITTLGNYESVELFLHRARLADPKFALTEKNVRALAEVCRKLEGIPLALELAAARVKVLPLEEILGRLQDQLRLLTAGARRWSPRQHTMRAAIAWSYDLLTEAERAFFSLFSIFVGGFTLEAAEAVWGRGASREADVLDAVASLVDKSLLHKQDGESGVRFGMLEVVREFASERFETDHGMVEADRRHAEYFHSLVARAATEFDGDAAAHSFALLEEETGNVRRALQWLLDNDAEACLRMCVALGRAWVTQGLITEGRTWLDAALQRTERVSPSLRTMGLRRAGLLARWHGDTAAARGLLEESLRVAISAADATAVAAAKMSLGSVALNEGNHEAARDYLGESLRVAREIGDEHLVTGCLNTLGEMARLEGDLSTARSLYEEAIASHRRTENRRALMAPLFNLGATVFLQGDVPTARSSFKEAFALAREFGSKPAISSALDAFAALASSEGQWRRAARLAGAASALRESIGYDLDEPDQSFRDRYLEAVRSNLTAQSFDECLTEGRVAGLKQAVREALEYAGT